MTLVTVEVQGADGVTRDVILDQVGSDFYPVYKLTAGVLGVAGSIVSPTNPLPTSHHFLDIAKGNLPDHSFIHKFGLNADIDQTEEDIWTQGETYTFMTTASTLYISSSDSGDDQTYEVQGLDANFDEQTVTVTADGNNFVALTGTWMRVFRIKNTGTTNNAGDIYISDNNTDAGGDGVPDTASNIKAKIDVGENQTLMAIYTIPNGKTGYMQCWFATLAKKVAAFSIVRHLRREDGGVFQVKEVIALASTGTSTFKRCYDVPDMIPGKTDIVIRADSSANDVGVSAGFDLILIDN